MSAFDPAAATAAYLAMLPAAAHAKATAYTHSEHWLLLWNWLAGVVVALVVLKTGLLARLRDRIEARRPRPKLVAFASGVVFAAISFLLSLPWDSYASWHHEVSYGLSHQSWASWLSDQLKLQGVNLVVTGLLAMCIYILIRRAPRSWWAWAGGVVAAFICVGLLLSPMLIEPLVNRYKPAPPGPLRDEVVHMAQVLGVPSGRIYIYDGSKQSEAYSANAGGIGATARIAMSDTMFKQGADLAEVRGVLGHEMGHYRLHHNYWLVATFSLLAIALFGLAHLLFPAVLARLGEGGRVRGLADPAGIPILTIIITTLALATTPIVRSSTRIIEQQADDFSLAHVHEPDGLAKALVKTIEYRAATPGWLEETLFYDHPAVGRRIRRQMDWKAAHPDLVGKPVA